MHFLIPLTVLHRGEGLSIETVVFFVFSTGLNETFKLGFSYFEAGNICQSYFHFDHLYEYHLNCFLFSLLSKLTHYHYNHILFSRSPGSSVG